MADKPKIETASSFKLEESHGGFDPNTYRSKELHVGNCVSRAISHAMFKNNERLRGTSAWNPNYDSLEHTYNFVNQTIRRQMAKVERSDYSGWKRHASAMNGVSHEVMDSVLEQLGWKKVSYEKNMSHKDIHKLSFSENAGDPDNGIGSGNGIVLSVRKTERTRTGHATFVNKGTVTDTYDPFVEKGYYINSKGQEAGDMPVGKYVRAAWYLPAEHTNLFPIYRFTRNPNHTNKSGDTSTPMSYADRSFANTMNAGMNFQKYWKENFTKSGMRRKSRDS